LNAWPDRGASSLAQLEGRSKPIAVQCDIFPLTAGVQVATNNIVNYSGINLTDLLGYDNLQA